MARFDVYLVAGQLYLDVQTDLLPSTGTRLVVPLLPSDRPFKPVRKLHPAFVVGGRSVVMATHLMVAVPERSLGSPIRSLHDQYDQIIAAIDMIFLGF